MPFVTEVNAAGSALVLLDLPGRQHVRRGLWHRGGRCGRSVPYGSSPAATFRSVNAFQPGYGGGDSDAFLVKLGMGSTTTAIISSAPNPSNEGQAVTVNFALAVTAPGAGVPTGTVTVSDGTLNCLAALPATSCNLTFTSPGVRNLTATYAGDANFNPSTSPAVAQTVNNLVPTITSISPTWSALA